MASRRCHYDAALKRKVISEAEVTGNCAAGRKFGVPENNVRRWHKHKTLLLACAVTRKGFRGPRKEPFPKEEEVLTDFIKERRGRSLAVTAIPEAMVAASFRKGCISNALDGTEDADLFECESDKDDSDATTFEDDSF